MSASRYRVDDLLAVALLQPQPAAGLTPSEVQKATLTRLLEELERGVRAVETIERALEQLTSSGDVRRQKSRYALTNEGRTRAHRVLGLSRELGPIKWDNLYFRYLTAAALGIASGLAADALERLGTADGLRRELVRQHLKLALDPVPQQKPFTNALGWALLERGASPEVISRARAAKKAFAVGAIVDVLCLTAAGLRSYAEGQGVEVLARHIAGAASRDWKELYRAVILRLFTPPAAGEARVSNGSAGHEVTSAVEDGIDVFARRVLAAAQQAPTGRIGEHLVFISHVWRELRRRGESIELDAFKERLGAAYRAHALHLTKADMPQTFDPQDLEQSCLIDRDVKLVFVETRGVHS